MSFLLVGIISCNEDDRILLDPNDLDNTILNLATATSESTANLGIQVFEVGATVDIMLQSSTLLGSARSFGVTIIEEKTTIEDIYFSLP